MNPISSSHMIQFKTYSFPFFPLCNVKKTGYISLQEEVSRKTRMLHNTVLKKGSKYILRGLSVQRPYGEYPSPTARRAQSLLGYRLRPYVAQNGKLCAVTPDTSNKLFVELRTKLPLQHTLFHRNPEDKYLKPHNVK